MKMNTNEWWKKLAAAVASIVIALGASLTVVGCEDEGPVEEAAEETQDAVEEAGDEVEEATD